MKKETSRQRWQYPNNRAQSIVAAMNDRKSALAAVGILCNSGQPCSAHRPLESNTGYYNFGECILPAITVSQGGHT